MNFRHCRFECTGSAASLIFMIVFMKTLTLLLTIALTSFFFDSCTVKEDITVDEAEKLSVTFPELDTFMPEEDASLQKRSSKRGVCTNFRIPEMPQFLGSGVTWCYNWGHSPLSDDRWAMLQSNGMVCLPMVWNAGFSQNNIATFKAKDPDADYLLGYNEPNLTDQANMTPQQAAAVWPDFVAAAKSLGLKIVGPAVNYGTLSGYNDPVKWYDEFLACPGVSIDDIDAIALHCYMPNGQAVKSLMIRKFVKYGKPIWLTEFENGEAQNEASQIGFCQETVTYLEADPHVERYAWFMDNTGSNNRAPHFPLITMPEMGGRESYLTDLGKTYVGLSSFDKETCYPVDHNIPAEHYSGQIIEETAGEEEWGTYVGTYPTSDFYGNLEIRNVKNDAWVEYRVNVPKTTKYRIDLRYNATSETVVKIDCAGATSAIATLAGNGEWTTAGVEMALPSGEQTIRLSVPVGSLTLNWLRVTAPLE